VHVCDGAAEAGEAAADVELDDDKKGLFKLLLLLQLVPPVTLPKMPIDTMTINQ